MFLTGEGPRPVKNSGIMCLGSDGIPVCWIQGDDGPLFSAARQYSKFAGSLSYIAIGFKNTLVIGYRPVFSKIPLDKLFIFI
jgi:hypothetical protein